MPRYNLTFSGLLTVCFLAAGCATEKGWNAGVAGQIVDSNDVVTARWAFPFYQWNWNGQVGYGAVLSGGIGWRQNSRHEVYKHWCYPFYERDDSAGTFDTLLYCSGPDNITLPPLLSRFYGARRGTLLLGLAGYSVSRSTNSLCAPFAISHHVFPFYEVTHGFDEPLVSGLLDRPESSVLRKPATWGLSDAKRRTAFENHDTFVLGSRSANLDISFPALTNTPVPAVPGPGGGTATNRGDVTSIAYATECMVFPFCSYRTWRSLRFQGDRLVEDGDRVSAVTLLSHFERRSSRLDGSIAHHDTILYFLYDYSDEDGATELSAFPGYCHVTRPDGYTKTSVLWRVFRWESDPTMGRRAMDLFLLPVYRSSPGQ